ncbi:MAG: DUF3524 domain-containing protein [Bacteroidetes bacterium]|nr:MAG: DUF3524 domain-containing protein [Bacteroidota bacterium]
MNILALEPWYGGSHRDFLDGLIGHSRHNFEAITMASRFWKWRMHGGAVTMARKAEQFVKNNGKPDLIFATDMVNLSAFLALARRDLSDVPVVLYMHENQLTYPLPDGEKRDYTYAYINYLACLAADRIVFNSRYHFDEFMEALPGLLRMFPDYTHLNTVRKIKDKCSVLHLGMTLNAHDKYASSSRSREWGPGMEPPIVLWNQRWEYDKNPEAFFKMMNRLDDIGMPFRLILAGEHFEVQPREFERAFERYADRILHYGYADDFPEYSKLLHRADLVVSTSIHEFFGISILEAIYCGCHPLLPNRLSYPELIPDSLHQPLLHAPILYEDDDDLFAIMCKILSGEDKLLPQSTLKDVSEHLEWSSQIVHYDDFLDKVLAEFVA